MLISNLRIIFYGTPDFAAESLRALYEAGCNIVGVVTAPDKAAGRGMKLQCSPVKLEAIELGLPVYQPTNLKSDEFKNTLHQLHPDLGVVIAFRMLPELVWSAPKLGTINLHGSLLPKYRGAAPIQHAIIQGETVTGLTIFFLKHEIDTGDILLREEIVIGEFENFGGLYDIMKRIGGRLIVKAVALISSGDYSLISQEETGTPSFAPKITKEFCKLDLHQNQNIVFNKIRGLSPSPGAWIEDANLGIVKIFETKKSNSQAISQDPIQIIGKAPYLYCSDGLLEIITLQFAGKPKISGTDYVNGTKNR